jgi:hypothetical protein
MTYLNAESPMTTHVQRNLLKQYTYSRCTIKVNASKASQSNRNLLVGISTVILLTDPGMMIVRQLYDAHEGLTRFLSWQRRLLRGRT